MELPRLTVLNKRFAIQRVLGDLGPFETTYAVKDIETGEQFIVREYLPVDLATREEDGIHLVPRSEKVAQLFRYGLEHLAREAVLCSEIDHPNVVRERGYFEENGTIYRVSDYHAGASLAYVLEQQGGRLSSRTAVTILMPLMDGIRAGHAQGLVHGSISPEKIYLTKTGRPMLLSFKTTYLLLARRTQKLASFQQPGFSPPEQYTQRGKHGPWSDVYGCGATLYRMLSGKQLPDVPSRLLDDIVPAMIDQTLELSLRTRNALKAALNLNPVHRPQSIEAFRALLVEDFDKANPNIFPPDEPPSEKDFVSPTKRTTLNQRIGQDAYSRAESAEAVHFAVKEEQRFGVPAANAFVEQKHFGRSVPNGEGALRTGVLNNRTESLESLAEGYDAPVDDYNSVFVPVARTGESKPAVFDRSPSIRSDNTWAADSPYVPGKNRELQRSSRRMIFMSLLIGGALMLAFLAYNRWQSRESSTYQMSSSGYASALLKGDSLFTLAKDVLEADNSERAELLFLRAKENYNVALTLSEGDKKPLRRRIDSVDFYLNKPVEVNLDEKESLAFISRGDSVMRAADALNIVGDSVQARTLYMQAREEYLKVLNVRPDDSLASARYRQANQRLVAPVRVEQPPAVEASPALSEGDLAQQLYLKFKMQGDSAFDARKLDEARMKFTEALAQKPNDPHATRRIAQINQMLAESERQGQYRQYVNSGNRLKEAGRLVEAKREFEFALQFENGDDAATKAIFEINSLLEQQQRKEQDYLSHKARGEVLLEKEDYEKALESFQSALAAKPDDEYASLKIKEIRETLNALSKQENDLPEGMMDDNGIYNFTEVPPILVGGREVLQSRLRYPPKAMEAGIEGRVSVRMIVDETGRMLNPTIQKGIRYDLDAEVLRVIRGARFEPGRVGGEPVKSWYTLYFEFKLDNE